MVFRVGRIGNPSYDLTLGKALASSTAAVACDLLST
jgi:hypothetical protein